MIISSTVRKMIMVMLVSAAIFIAVAFFISLQHAVLDIFPFAFGVLLSTAINIVKVVWLERAVDRATNMDDEKAAGAYIRGQYLLRFLMTGGILVAAAILSEGPSLLWGAVVGLFTFHPAKYSLAHIVKTEYKKDAQDA